MLERWNAKRERDGKEQFEALFHVAEIEVDAIISYP